MVDACLQYNKVIKSYTAVFTEVEALYLQNIVISEKKL